jgi:hypothetical protein
MRAPDLAMTDHTPPTADGPATCAASGVSAPACLILLAVLLTNIAWIAVTPVAAKTDDFITAAMLYGPFMLIVALCVRWRARVLAACIASLLLMLISTSIIGLNAMLGLTAAMPLIDARLAAMDAALRIDHLAIAAFMAEQRGLASVLAWFYNASGPLVLATGLALAITRRFERLCAYWLIYVACGAVTCLLAALWPAVGTYVFLGIPPLTGPDMPQGAAGTFHLADFERLRAGGAAALGPFDVQGVVTFPSFHCVMALVVAWGLWPLRWLRWFGVASAAVTIVATIPIGGHYVIDVIAGAALFAAVTTAVTAAAPARAAQEAPAPRLQAAE